MTGAGVQVLLGVAWAALGSAESVSGPDTGPRAPGVLTTEGDAGAGAVRVAWSLAPSSGAASSDGALTGEPVEFELQHAPTARFAAPMTRYRGPQRATVLTGLRDGEHWFRFRVLGDAPRAPGPWSEPVRFTVRHHSIATATTLFGLGAVVFAATALFLWHEDRRHRRDLATRSSSPDLA